MEKRLIDAYALKWELGKTADKYDTDYLFFDVIADEIDNAPTEDAVPVSKIKAYLQSKLDEWNALGDRKFEPANMWGYNFIMACFDDLEGKGADEEWLD